MHYGKNHPSQILHCSYGQSRIEYLKKDWNFGLTFAPGAAGMLRGDG